MGGEHAGTKHCAQRIGSRRSRVCVTQASVMGMAATAMGLGLNTSAAGRGLQARGAPMRLVTDAALQRYDGRRMI